MSPVLPNISVKVEEEDIIFVFTMELPKAYDSRMMRYLVRSALLFFKKGFDFAFVHLGRKCQIILLVTLRL